MKSPTSSSRHSYTRLPVPLTLPILKYVQAHTMALPLRLLHASQALLSLYGGYSSYIAITNLQKYEATTKKLAKWSNTVDEQLQKTRTTQSTGAVTILLSLIVSSTLALTPSSLPRWLLLTASPVVIIVSAVARQYIKNFWTSGDSNTVGTRVPLPNMEDYNKAQRATEQLLQVLQFLEYSWVGTALVGGMIGW